MAELRRCVICPNFETIGINEGKRHVAIVHAKGLFSTITCQLCHEKFYDFNHFDQHIRSSVQCRPYRNDLKIEPLAAHMTVHFNALFDQLIRVADAVASPPSVKSEDRGQSRASQDKNQPNDVSVIQVRPKPKPICIDLTDDGDESQGNTGSSSVASDFPVSEEISLKEVMVIDLTGDEQEEDLSVPMVDIEEQHRNLLDQMQVIKPEQEGAKVGDKTHGGDGHLNIGAEVQTSNGATGANGNGEEAENRNDESMEENQVEKAEFGNVKEEGKGETNKNASMEIADKSRVPQGGNYGNLKITRQKTSPAYAKLYQYIRDQFGKNIINGYSDCNKCGVRLKVARDSFIHPRIILTHVRSHLAVKLCGCKLCDFKTAHFDNVIMHMRKCHPGSEPSVTNCIDSTLDHVDEIKEIFRQCFGQRHPADGGKGSEQDVKPMTRTVDTKKVILKLEVTKTGSYRLQLDQCRQYVKKNELQCNLCSKKLLVISHGHGLVRTTVVHQHALTHSNFDLYKCCYCDKTNNSRSGMFRHITWVHADKPKSIIDLSEKYHDEIMQLLRRCFETKDDKQKALLEADNQSQNGPSTSAIIKNEEGLTAKKERSGRGLAWLLKLKAARKSALPKKSGKRGRKSRLSAVGTNPQSSVDADRFKGPWMKCTCCGHIEKHEKLFLGHMKMMHGLRLMDVEKYKV